MLVVQSCTDSLQVMAGSSTETFPTSPDGTYGIGNKNFEEDPDIKEGGGGECENREHNM